MYVSATRRYFEKSRAKTLPCIQAGFRSGLEYLAAHSWVTEIRQGSCDLFGGIAVSLRSWRPLDTELGRKVLDTLARIHGRSVTIAYEVYERCDPAMSKIYDHCAPVLERAARGVRELSIQAARHRQLTLMVLVVGLPAVSFVCFGLARWVADDIPAATDLAIASEGLEGRETYRPFDGQLRISTTLVEPPGHGARAPAATLLVARVEQRRVIGDRAAERALPGMPAARQIRLEPLDARSATATISYSPPDRQPPAEDTGSARVVALPPAPMESAATEAPPADPDATLYPFVPRPRPSRNSDTASTTQQAPATSEAGPTVGVGGTVETIYRVQLAAVRGHDQAMVMWDNLTATHSDLLGSLEPDISARKTRQNRRIYRLRAGPLASRADADAVCSALERRNVDCLVIKASG